MVVVQFGVEKNVLYKTHVLDVCVACGSCRRIQRFMFCDDEIIEQ